MQSWPISRRETRSFRACGKIFLQNLGLKLVGDRIINVVAALIRDSAGRVLLVRKRGTLAFMQLGGKRNAGESDVTALSREIVEELGCCIDQRSARAVGIFECAAANEPGFKVRAAVYAVDIEGAVKPQAEIEQFVWVDPKALPDLHLAPLTRDHVLPLVAR
jgi:8-oxo-dGTP diphosphatase